MGPIWEIARNLFTGPGAVLWELMFTAVGGYFLSYLAAAVGNIQVSRMIGLTAMFISVALVVNTAIKAIVAVAKMCGF